MQQAVGAPAPAPTGPPQNGGGRASRRGGTKGEPRPGDGAEKVTQAMAQMSFGGDEPPRRRAEMHYVEPHTRPQGLVDKKGMYSFRNF